MIKKIYIISGGTFVDVAPHFSLAARAFGQVGVDLEREFLSQADSKSYLVVPVFTTMASGQWAKFERSLYNEVQSLFEDAGMRGGIVTNDDLLKFVLHLKTLADTKIIVMAAAVCDWAPKLLLEDELHQYDGHEVTYSHASERKDFGRKTPRLRTRLANGKPNKSQLWLEPSTKIISEIRAGENPRKDIFVVGFKTTASFSQDEQYLAALGMMKENSINLVLANDIDTRCNLIVTPEEARYPALIQDPAAPWLRQHVLTFLARMALSRSEGKFTRSTVVGGEEDLVPWKDERIPENLRKVVDWCLANGAYKPVTTKGGKKTVGHFAVKLSDGQFLTSLRKTDFNTDLAARGLVRIETVGDSQVIAHGARPSVGGQSQRAVFRENPDTDCIVHFHCPTKEQAEDNVNVVQQWPNECGSHQCGEATAAGLRQHGALRAVMLDNHGPNIVFSKDVPADEVIRFIQKNFDLTRKTGGLVA